MVRRLFISSLIVGALSVAGGGAAFAAANPSGQGQPGVECEDFSAAPPGFATGGFANAEEHYAGNGASADHTDNPHAVSQYDVACYQVSQH